MSVRLHLSYFDNIQNPHNSLIHDDPVRPHIPAYMRYAHNRGIFSLTHHDYFQPEAISCVSYMGHVPEGEDDLFDDKRSYDVAVFYTVWSYPRSVNGAGRKLINAAVDHIRWFKPFVKRVATLSPKTEMARRFHTLNGAFEFRENETTINYEYKI
jgi:hypothetical protein